MAETARRHTYPKSHRLGGRLQFAAVFDAKVRESFRLMQHDLPRGYDFVVVVRPHDPLMLADYQRLMSGMFVKLHGAWQRRGPQSQEPAK